MHRISLAILINQLVLCHCRIHLFVYKAETKNGVLVDYYGNEDKVVTSLEERLFNITDENLKRGVDIELGKMPDDVFLKESTRYGNLYKKYKWTPVMRRMQVKKMEVIEVTSDRVVVRSHEHINNTTKSIKCDAAVSGTVEDTISSAWSKDGWPEDEIHYDIHYSYNGSTVKYRNQWRHANYQNRSLPFEVKKNGYINIMPGQRVTSILNGLKTTIQIRVHYAASLIGQAVLNYAHVYGNYHFWAPKVADIMKAAGLENEIVTSELIVVRYYTQPELEIFDSDTKKPVDVAPFCKLVKLGLICTFSRSDHCQKVEGGV